MAAAAIAVDDHIAAHNADGQYGPATRRYWAISHARQPEGTAVEPPAGNTFAQLQHIDALQRGIDAANDERVRESEFVTVTCRLNGGLIPLELRVSELRAALGLPQYPLCPPYRGSTHSPTAFENILDVDHEEGDIEMQ